MPWCGWLLQHYPNICCTKSKQKRTRGSNSQSKTSGAKRTKTLANRHSQEKKFKKEPKLVPDAGRKSDGRLPNSNWSLNYWWWPRLKFLNIRRNQWFQYSPLLPLRTDHLPSKQTQKFSVIPLLFDEALPWRISMSAADSCLNFKWKYLISTTSLLQFFDNVTVGKGIVGHQKTITRPKNVSWKCLENWSSVNWGTFIWPKKSQSEK